MSATTAPGSTPVPRGRSARRLEWPFLPPHLRAHIEQQLGSAVTGTSSCTSGFTPGFASVLACVDGSRHFVKAASSVAQRAVAASYREEIGVLEQLPSSAPAPRLLWSLDDDWVVLATEHVVGQAPQRPWQPAELEACLAAAAAMVAPLTPVPAELPAHPFATELGDPVTTWTHVRATRPDLGHLDEAADLAAGFAAVTTGDTLVHTDLRDDNLILDEEGRVWMCDWNWPAAGAPWLDSLLLLIGPRGDGVDVEQAIAGSSQLAGVPAEHVDRVLAMLAGHFLQQSDLRVPSVSPHLRAFQAWQGAVVWHWLAERRGWR